MSEKTEKATPYKLQKAKEKGQVSKSLELNSSIFLFIMVGLITALWPQLLEELENLSRHLLNMASLFSFSPSNIMHMHQFILNQLMNMWLPFALAAIITLCLSSIAQTGFVWSATPLTPNLKRLSIKKGLKKICSVKTGIEALKSICKLAIVIVFLYFSLNAQIPHILSLSLERPTQVPTFMMHFILKILIQLFTLLLSLAFIDRWYTRWAFNKEQRMSKQEIKDEYKQREGDPKIKSKIKQLQAQLRQKTASLNQIKTADVIITNPTHLAVALKYERGIMPAPKVVCKAQDELVSEVKKLAKKYGIVIIENKLFARLVYQSTELNEYIPHHLFPLAAPIFKELYQQRVELC